VTLLYLQ